MQTRHIPPLLIMILSGVIGIRLALSPVAVTGTTCTEDHPYYPSCEEPDWTATPVTVYPTASEDDLPDTDPPIQIPTLTATKMATPTITPTPIIQIAMQTSTVLPQNDASVLPAIPTMIIISTPIRNNTSANQPTPVALDDLRNAMICTRQERITIRGITDPHTLLLIRFDERVVGGGVSQASGSYTIPLFVGDERRGIHRIEIIQRSTNKVLKRLSCTVP